MYKNSRYLNFPVPALRILHTDSESFFKSVINIGIFLFSKQFEGNEIERYEEAKEVLGINQYAKAQENINKAKDHLSYYPCNSPIVGISVDMYFDFLKNPKSPYELKCLAAFLGIKSIIGTKPYCKTNKALIHARMFGYASVKDVPSKPVKEEAKYKIRWHMDKLLFDLQLNWNLKLYSNHQRGMLLSFDVTLEELVKRSEESKLKNRMEAFRNEKRKAIEQAKQKNNK